MSDGSIQKGTGGKRYEGGRIPGGIMPSRSVSSEMTECPVCGIRHQPNGSPYAVPGACNDVGVQFLRKHQADSSEDFTWHLERAFPHLKGKGMSREQFRGLLHQKR